ncbi:hypothetical protein NECAME_01031 [Necator americanus]|uniref:Uncharacterized protein n=1 Tax=Necator americanus TaxID=51031 RepID=W2SKJ8_NECAM|nr:hypothetical protein NECAME_01031 [Necator americanus]ETN70083.1 hypothetical protein NECAME_01031 [Necator americanus]
MASGDGEGMIIDDDSKKYEDVELPCKHKTVVNVCVIVGGVSNSLLCVYQSLFKAKITPSCSMVSKPAVEFEVELNGFMMNIKSLPKEVYHYRVSLTKITDRKTRDLTRGQKQDYAVQLRRRVCMSLFNTATKKRADLFPRSSKYAYIYDCGNSLYMKQSLPDDRGDASIKIELLPEDITSKNTKAYLGTACLKVEVEFQFTHILNPCLVGEVEQIRETQRLLEVITSAGMVKNEDHILFGNKAYERSSQRDVALSQGKVVNKEVAIFRTNIGGKFLRKFSWTGQSTWSFPGRRPEKSPNCLRCYETAERVKFDYEGEEVTVNEYFLRRYKRHLQ